MKRAIIAISALLLAGCTDPPSATRALDNLGMTEIEMTGYQIFDCSQGDVFHTGFKAKNPNGKPVTGTVCAGWFKNSTVRFD